LTLAGHLYLPVGGQPPHPAVIVCHGLISRKDNHAEFARFLQKRGFAALVFDWRGMGRARVVWTPMFSTTSARPSPTYVDG